MKLRQDFVTNSSSTSFIISLKDNWNSDNFLKNIGVLDDSALRNIFAKFFRVIDDNKEEIKKYISEYYPEMDTVEAFLKHNSYSDEVIQEVHTLIKEGRTVYYGELSTENGNSIEAFFCMESFIVCDENIYFNGQKAVW